MTTNRLQFRHHLEAFSSRDEALDFLAGLVDNTQGAAPIGESKIGEPIVVEYKNGEDDKDIHLILAIGKMEGGTGVEYHYIDSDNLESAIKALEEIVNQHDADLKKLLESMGDLSDSIISKITINGKDAEIVNNEASVTINGGDILLDGYVKADDPKDAVHPEDDVNKAIGKLESKSDNNDERLKELETVHPDGITIGSTEKDGNNFLGTLLKISKVENPAGSDIEALYELTDALGNKLGEQVVIKKNNQFADGLAVQDNVVSVLRDNNCEPFLTVSANGLKLAGVQDAIDNAVNPVSTKVDNNEAAVNTISNSLQSEIQRAQSEEARIETLIGNKIDTEVLERKAAISDALQESKDYTDGEIAGLAASVTANKISVSAPLTIAESATGTSVGMKITEGSKILNIENNGLKASVGISYDDVNSRIILTGIDGQEISSIDARQFIKDGMLDDVAVTTENGVKYIEFTFNTESGKDVIKFAVEEIFQPYKESDGIAISTDNAIVLKIDNSGDGKYLKLTTAGLGLQDITPTIDNAVATLNNSLALIEQRVKSNEDELSVLDNTIKSTIKGSMIAKVVTTINPAEAEAQTLIRRIDDQYYVDSTTSSMSHKGESLESVIDNLSGSVVDALNQIGDLRDDLDALRGEIDALKGQNENLSNQIDDIMAILNGMMKIKSITGTGKEISVTNNDGNIVIGFEDNAVFGSI